MVLNAKITDPKYLWVLTIKVAFDIVYNFSGVKCKPTVKRTKERRNKDYNPVIYTDAMHITTRL